MIWSGNKKSLFHATHSLFVLLKRHYETVTFPSKWSTCISVLIPKRRNANNCNHYGEMTLTSTVSKLYTYIFNRIDYVGREVEEHSRRTEMI